jgi:multiple sugar transport system permease protein
MNAPIPKPVVRATRAEPWLHLALLVAGALTLFPFIWMLGASFKAPTDIFQPGFQPFPSRPTLENYSEAFARAPLWRFLLNGVIVCAGVLIGQLLVIIPAGYAFAKLEFAGRDKLFAVVIAALLVPGYITAIPNFILFSDLRLLDTYWALIVPFWGSSFGTFLMRQFIKQIPNEILDAARLDGANNVQLVWYVLLPLIRPAIAAFTIFSLITHWNDFFWPLVVLRSESMFTPPAGIVYFAGAEGSKWGLIMAAAVVVIAPLLVAFLLMRKQFVESLSRSAVKG